MHLIFRRVTHHRRKATGPLTGRPAAGRQAVGQWLKGLTWAKRAAASKAASGQWRPLEAKQRPLMDMDEDRSMWKIWDVTNRSIVVIMLAIVPTAIFYVVSCCYCWTTSNGLPGILPDILTYKTCVYTPPGFSPGCMDNVTVYPGGTATFNCQVRQIFFS